jgi:hypothetical protein
MEIAERPVDQAGPPLNNLAAASAGEMRRSDDGFFLFQHPLDAAGTG